VRVAASCRQSPPLPPQLPTEVTVTMPHQVAARSSAQDHEHPAQGLLVHLRNSAHPAADASREVLFRRPVPPPRAGPHRWRPWPAQHTAGFLRALRGTNPKSGAPIFPLCGSRQPHRSPPTHRQRSAHSAGQPPPRAACPHARRQTRPSRHSPAISLRGITPARVAPRKLCECGSVAWESGT
jgi:hypothetical protein